MSELEIGRDVCVCVGGLIRWLHVFCHIATIERKPRSENEVVVATFRVITRKKKSNFGLEQFLSDF